MKSIETARRRQTRPLLGLRQRPGRLVLAVFRLPLVLYRHGGGWLLGTTFMLLVHAGRTTQVWDAEVTDESNGKKIALFRCTQLILYPGKEVGDKG